MLWPFREFLEVTSSRLRCWCHGLTPRPTCIDDPLQITVVGISVQPPESDVENMQKSGSVKEGMLKFALEGGRMLEQPLLQRQGWVRQKLSRFVS